MISRRDFLGTSLTAGAALALAPELLFAQGGKLRQRTIPSSGEMLPVIGLQFGNPPRQGAPLAEVLKAFTGNGGTFLDAVHQATAPEDETASAVTGLNIRDRVFLSTRAAPAGPPQPGSAAAKAHMESSLTRFKATRLDLVLMNPLADPGHLAALKEMKQAGRVRYIGMQVIDDRQYAGLEAVMRKEPLDFIGVDYSINNRGAELTILPLAMERKMAVVTYMPFNQGSLFQRAAATPLPSWAADFDAKTWAQFFLKFVLSHPAVTVARAGTNNPAHMVENIGGGIGRLPDEATRKRMADLVAAWPA